MKISTKQTKVYELEYKIWMNDENNFMTMTEWANGEGFDIDIETKRTSKHFSLHETEMNALLILWGKSNLHEPENKEE